METEEKKRTNSTKEIFDWLEVIISSVLIVVVLFTFVFRVVNIEGESMTDTLQDSERVIISNLFYTPKQGDIVVVSRNTLNSPDKSSYKTPIIKRVIAVAGQTVDIQNGCVYVDGRALDEPYIRNYAVNKHSTYQYGEYLNATTFPLTVKENCVFVLGDNRMNSLDSRSNDIGTGGQINIKYILGKAMFRIFPINKFGTIY
ncbi:MAG: signal peptidase I [Oscillospiraceae bacterium]|nr:signal peptidase I [Candidatus Equicaccousia limihippi]